MTKDIALAIARSTMIATLAIAPNVAAAQQSSPGAAIVPSPAPPAIPPVMPPPLPDDPVVWATLKNTHACINGLGNRGAADQAVRKLTAPPGSPEWIKVRDIVAAYVREREQVRVCINELEHYRFVTQMSARDLNIVLDHERGLIAFYLEQGAFESGILARFIGIDVHPENVPIWLSWPPSHARQVPTK